MHKRWLWGLVPLMLVGALLSAPSALGVGHASNTTSERFLIVTTDPSNNAVPVVLGWGPIHAKGVDQVMNSTTDVFSFPAGSITVVHHPRHRAQTADVTTCLFRYFERGNYRVTGGTGAYAHAHGYGRYFVTVLSVGCQQNQPPEVFQEKIHASGPFAL